MSDENADSQAKEKSAKQMSDKNADSQAKEKSAKQLFDKNADLITITYTFCNHTMVRITKHYAN